MLKQLLFIGDSLTEWGNWIELFPEYEIINQGVAGEKTAQILSRVNAFPQYMPHKVFLMAGINDLGDKLPLATIMENYQKIATTITSRWGAKNCFLLSILPVDFASFTHTAVNPPNVQHLNIQIAELALKLNTTFINLGPYFADFSGNLDPKYTYDGLHLSKLGYQLWKDKIEPYIEQ